MKKTSRRHLSNTWIQIFQIVLKYNYTTIFQPSTWQWVSLCGKVHRKEVKNFNHPKDLWKISPLNGLNAELGLILYEFDGFLMGFKVSPQESCDLSWWPCGNKLWFNALYNSCLCILLPTRKQGSTDVLNFQVSHYTTRYHSSANSTLNRLWIHIHNGKVDNRKNW